MPKCALLAVLLLIGTAAPHRAEGQRPVQVAFADPQPHFVAAWAPAKEREAERAAVLVQRVSLELTDVPLDAALKALTKEAGLRMTYSPTVLPSGRRVTISAKDIAVVTALTEMLFRSGVDVVVDREGGMGLVRCRHAVPSVEANDTAVIFGRVTDKTTGAPITGGNVAVQGTTLTAVTDNTGHYRIPAAKPGLYTIQARYIGYVLSSGQVTVGDEQQVEVNFELERSAHRLDEVVVTGTVVPTEMKAIPTPITVITSQEIERQNVHRVDQLFRGQVPGSFAWEQTTQDHYSTIGVRGASSFRVNTVKTFIDGVEVSDPAFIATVDPNSIERVELTRGPQASTIYGSDATGGVLQMFTKAGRLGLKRPEIEAKLVMGLVNNTGVDGSTVRYDNSVAVIGGGEHTSYRVGGALLHDGPWAPQYQSTSWSGSAGANTTQGALTLGVTARYASKSFDAAWVPELRRSGAVYFSRPPNEQGELRQQTVGATVGLAATPHWRHELTVGYDRSALDYGRTRPRFTTPDDSLLWLSSGQSGKASLLYSTTFDWGLARDVGAVVTGGVNHYFRDLSQNFTDQATRLDGNVDGVSFPLRYSFTNTGYFGQLRLDLFQALFVTAGLRAEVNDNFGPDYGAAWSPRIGISYVQPVGIARVKVRAAYGESVRPPNPTENQATRSSFSQQLANPTLGPERQHGPDGGVEIYFGTVGRLGATYYTQRATDLIDFVLVDATTVPVTYQYQNVGRIKNRGWEFDGGLNVGALQLGATLSLTRSTVQQLASSYSGDYRLDDPILSIPHVTAGATASYSTRTGTVINAAVTHVGQWIENDWLALYGFFYGGDQYRGSGRAYWTSYPGFTKLNVGVTQSLGKSITGIAQVENLTNNRAFEQNNLFVPLGRIVTVGVRARY
jgi:outer membrane receptor protein involved in Fe transport